MIKSADKGAQAAPSPPAKSKNPARNRGGEKARPRAKPVSGEARKASSGDDPAATAKAEDVELDEEDVELDGVQKAAPSKENEDDEDDEGDESGANGDSGDKKPRRGAQKAEDAEDEADEADDEAEQEEEDGDVTLAPEMRTALKQVLAESMQRLQALADLVEDAAPAADDEESEMPPELEEELDAVGDLLDGVTKRLPAGKTVQKRGRRMAKERFNRLKGALDTLAGLLQELSYDGKPASPQAAPSAASKAAPAADIGGPLGQLVGNVQALTQVVVRQDAELQQLRKARGLSNALPVEGPRKARRADQAVSWPLDMNRPISREGVEKAVSFFDD